MYGYLYFENWGLERLLNDVGFVPNLNINAENLSSSSSSSSSYSFFKKNVFETLRVRARSGLRAQADSCVHMPRASLALFFQKYIYLLIKSYIFHLKIFQVNLTSNWFLNQPWVIEF